VYALVFACAALVLVSAIAFDVQRRQRSLSVLRLLGMTKMHVSWLLINQISAYRLIGLSAFCKSYCNPPGREYSVSCLTWNVIIFSLAEPASGKPHQVELGRGKAIPAFLYVLYR